MGGDTPSRSVRGDAGFGLVEVMVALLILGIMSAAVVGIILQAQSQSATNRSRIAASNLAAREIDIVRDEFHRSKAAPRQIAELGTIVNPHQLDGQVTGQPLVIDGTAYTVTRDVSWNLLREGESACDGGSLVKYPTLGVTVTVTWPNMGAVRPVVSTAAFAPDKGSGVALTDSFVAVKVTDQDGEPSPGRTVRVTGGGQTVSDTTDATGCAVVTVTPPAGVGTSYSAQVVDAGYVDIAGTANPTKGVGTLSQGQLNNNVTFQVAPAGTVRIHVVDSAGTPIAAAPEGAVVTLHAAEYSGESAERTFPVTGPLVTVSGLWPTEYSAYYGTVPPGGDLEITELPAGGTIDLDAVIELARTRVVNLPPGVTGVVVAGPDATTCTGATPVDPNDVALLPGDWRFFAVGAPSVACSPGPAVSLVGGSNPDVIWDTFALTVTGQPAGSSLFAVEASRVTNPSTCPPAPSSPGAVVAVNPSGTELMAGTWYVYATVGSGCTVPGNGQYPIVVDGDRSLTWGEHKVTLQVTSIERLGTSYSRSYWPSLYVASTNVIGGSSGPRLSCPSTSVYPSGVTASGGATVYPLTTSPRTSGSTAAWSPQPSIQLGEGTWYVIGKDETGRGFWSSSSLCRVAGTVTIGPLTPSPVSLNYTVAN